MNKIFFVLACALALTACDQNTTRDDSSKTSIEALEDDVISDSNEQFVFQAPFEGLETILPTGIVISASDESSITIGGLLNDPTSGQTTGGYAIKLPDVVEQTVSGQKIKISIFLEGAGADDTKFRLAYSTNEVGNSGWVVFDAIEANDEHSFEYEVNPMKNGRGDFIGFDPMSGTFVVTSVKIVILD
jgi:hypothetical protein